MNNFHNPENLTPEQYGAKEGWRLLTIEEMRDPQRDIQMFGCLKQWIDSKLSGTRFTLARSVTYRTRAPLPHAESSWIKMSDRKPTEADANAEGNVWFWNPARSCPQDDFWNTGGWATHWMPKPWVAPAPPAKEPTRDEQDKAAFQHWHHFAHAMSPESAWDAALLYERSSLRLILAKYTANDITIQQLVAEIKGRVE